MTPTPLDGYKKLAAFVFGCLLGAIPDLCGKTLSDSVLLYLFTLTAGYLGLQGTIDFKKKGALPDPKMLDGRP